LPLYLEAARHISGPVLEDLPTRLGVLLAAAPTFSEGGLKHHLFMAAKLVDKFLKGCPINVLHDNELLPLLTREWTGGWNELLNDEIMWSKPHRVALEELMKKLMSPSNRWRLSSTFALSNVISALVDAKALQHIEGEFRYCNLKGTTFDDVVFKNARFVAVDCTRARFVNSCLDDSRFIATDFTDCDKEKWAGVKGPKEWGTVFVECEGSYPGHYNG
jgi:hypothetical protein